MKHWWRTRASRALCVAESECYAIGAGRADGMQSWLSDLGLGADVRVWTDSNAAKAIASRRGWCKTGHNELGCLWVQSA